VLKEHAAGLSAGELCRKYGISDATFYKWRSRYGGMEISDASTVASAFTLRPLASYGVALDGDSRLKLASPINDRFPYQRAGMVRCQERSFRPSYLVTVLWWGTG